MADLADLIARQGSDLRLRQAIVTSVPAGGTCTIRFGDLASTTSADDIAGVRCLTDVGNGDTIWVLQTGGALLIIGTITTGWIEVTSFLNSWANYGAGFPTAAYRKVGDTVHLKGLLAGGTVDVDAFTLPVGYRPANGRHYMTMMGGGAGGLRVSTGGGVRFGTPNTANNYCSLDGIYFETSG